MTFNSLEFLIFFPITTILYFLLPHRLRWVLLLIASIIFYAAFIPKYVFVLSALILIDYSAGILIEGSSNNKKRKALLIISILSTCSVLFVFKYFNFFNVNLEAIANLLDWNYSVSPLKLLLPIGLSFHTFQSLAYVVEVYRGRQRAEKNVGIYALYVMFYPQLVAGPIERPQHLIPQLRAEHDFEYDRVVAGLRRMLWGMFKKVVVADNLALLVDSVYANPQSRGSTTLLFATILFAIQIYADFSGYVDIAIGSAKVLGFELVENFRDPYLANSIPDFWRRWHISLFSWFRDYIYIPMGGNRVSNAKWTFNILTVFLISGLWHGASWTFIAWGFLHGIYIAFSKATGKFRAKIVSLLRLSEFPRLHHLLQIIITFSLVSFAWIFFRAENISDAWYVASSVLLGLVELPRYIIDNVAQDWQTSYLAILLSGTILLLMHLHFNFQGLSVVYNFFFCSEATLVRWTTYLVVLWAILLFGVLGGYSPFIYFAF